MNRTRILQGILFLIGGLLFCSGCARQEDPDDTARDVSAAAAEGRDEIADAAQAANESAADSAKEIRNADDASDRREAIADAQERTGATRHEVAMEKAEADRDIAKQKWVEQQRNCNEAVEAAHEKARADADRMKDAADERATVTRESP